MLTVLVTTRLQRLLHSESEVCGLGVKGEADAVPVLCSDMLGTYSSW